MSALVVKGETKVAAVTVTLTFFLSSLWLSAPAQGFGAGQASSALEGRERRSRDTLLVPGSGEVKRIAHLLQRRLKTKICKQT